ncbi:MAG: hypothetical protein QOH43_151 [Solirubrobacteraceae bacterium]|jgi:hypothetical protein|nr:hypothetical protein [Solirubrobacteraceae bacterium]
MRRSIPLSTAVAALAAVVLPVQAGADGVKRTAAGATPADITAARDLFRADVGGGATAGANGSFGGLRREINWDGVPETASDPIPFPAGFFNATTPRGVEFATTGTGFQVSANAGGTTPVLFNNPGFQTFSAQKLFSPVGAPVTDVHFFVPGTATPATTNAFGVVFTDVDTAGAAKLEFFDPAGALLDTVVAPPSPTGGLSFAGDTFTAGERVGRVRITSGSRSLAPVEAAGEDVVAMDDFLYGEPLPGQLAFQVAAARVDEDAGRAVLTVARAGANAAPATVAFATADGTAVAGQDYTPASGTLNFGAGDATKQIEVPISADAARESDEAFSVNLSNPSGAALAAPQVATVTIQDRTAAPAPRDAQRPRGTLARLRASGLRFLVASDEAGRYESKLTLTAAQARKVRLSRRTLASTAARTLRAGGNTLTLKVAARTATRLRRAKIRPTLTVLLRDAAGNTTTLRQRVSP